MIVVKDEDSMIAESFRRGKEQSYLSNRWYVLEPTNVAKVLYGRNSTQNAKKLVSVLAQSFGDQKFDRSTAELVLIDQAGVLDEQVPTVFNELQRGGVIREYLSPQ